MQNEDDSTKSECVTVLTFDLETDNLGEGLAFSASPFYKENDIVAESWSLSYITDDGEVIESIPYGVHVLAGVTKDTPSFDKYTDVFDREEAPWLVAGHNVRFDLNYLRRAYESDTGLQDGLELTLRSLRDGTTLLWDTQFAEYLLTGQSEKMISLNVLADKYGVGKKHDDVTEFWKEGYSTRDIDPDLLAEYCVNDVSLTQEIALKQIALAEESGLLDFILQQMRSLYVVHEYEFNGIRVDHSRLEDIEWLHTRRSEACANDYNVLFLSLPEVKALAEELSYSEGFDLHEAEAMVEEHVCSIDSTVQMKKILFGGVEEVKIPYRAGVWRTGKKAGEPRYRYIKRELKYEPQLEIESVPEECLTEKGKEVLKNGGILSSNFVSITEDTAEILLRVSTLPSTYEALLDKYSTYRFHKKIVSTYCKNLKGYTFEDGNVHGNYNVDLTPTGRLTSSNPNMQNLPSDDASNLKEVFVSRWDDGKIGVVDFKQLEIVGLAFLSGDENLIRDLIDGVDIHTKVGRLIGSDTSTGDLRRDMKRVVFGTIYGAGVTKLAQGNNFSKEGITRIKRTLASQYPRAFKDFPERVSDELFDNAKHHGRTSDGMVVLSGMLEQPSGRRIKFVQERDTFGGRGVFWPYTCTKNWPVQSIAADIVSVARVVFFDTIRELSLENDVKMVNEVHDEIVFDVRCSDTQFDGLVEMVELRLPDALKNAWGCKDSFSLPLKLESGLGANWKQAK